MKATLIILLIFLLVAAASPQEQKTRATPNFTGMYELVSLKGNMYPNGPPKRRLEVTQSEASINVVRVEGEKYWARDVQFQGQKTENSAASPEDCKAKFKGDELTFEIVKMIPPEMVKPGSRETEVWKLVDDGKKLKIERRIEFLIPGISIQEKKASELYERVQTTSNSN